ncbi:MAG: trypsin-like peptidase domain-containing protein [Minisyncoccia bacterium]
MEDLNKNQIVLLTILLSFVTSIATGIMTVSLLQEAPVEVTRTINQVVEKTIETVRPVVTNNNIQKEIQTVVVKEEDQVIESINKNVKSIVRISERNPFTDVTSFYGIGIILTKEGLLAADRKTVLKTNIYSATLSDGTVVKVEPQDIEKQTNFIIFKVEDSTKLTFISASLSDVDTKLGQTLISVGGMDSNSIAVGRVVSFNMKETLVGTSTTKYVAGINTDGSSKDLVNGSPLLNLSGDIVGVRLSNDELRTFTTISTLKKELSGLIEPAESPAKRQ